MNFTTPKCLAALAIAALLTACAVPPTMPPASTPSTSPELQQAIGAALSADMPRTMSLLGAMKTDGLTDTQRQVRECILQRFSQDEAPPLPENAVPPTARPILAAYRSYWHGVLMKRVPTEEAQVRLLAALNAALPPTTAASAASLDTRSEDARAFLDTQGVHALAGVTSPLYELMVWRRQTVEKQHVELPDGAAIGVNVLLLDDFASLGWAAYATCDRIHTGGWATPEGIHVVVPSWKLDSEAYRISLLAHESQHYADYAAFPKLAQTDLEYRAKLVELIQSRETTKHLLERFASASEHRRELPHPFANHWVIARLTESLGKPPQDVDAELVRASAASLLRSHTAALQAQGRDTVTTALPD